MNRRDYLMAVGALSAGATIPIAGCSTAVASVPAPRFPEMEGWKRLDERRETLFEREVVGRQIEARAHAVAHEDATLRRRFANALGSIGHPVSLLAASRVDVSLDLDRVVDADVDLLKRVERRGRERFEARLARAGIRNLQRTEAGEVTVDTGETARLFHYVADLSLPARTVPVAADLAVWRHDGSVLITGAAYPAAIEDHLPEGVDIAFDPDAYRSNVRETITAIR